MRILVVGGIQRATNELALKDIRASAADVWSFFLRREMDCLGVETLFYPATNAAATEGETWGHFKSNPIPPNCDHVLSVEQRGFANRCGLFHRKLSASVPGLVVTICDHNKVTGPEDILFHCLGEPSRPNHIKIGWAADGEILRPRQQQRLRFLVDHRYYGDSLPDLTDGILDQCVSQDATVRHFCSGRVIDTSKARINPHYRQTAVGWIEAAREYGQAHAFFVTHPESLGLSIVESAMSGALIVAPQGFIQPEYLSALQHVEWDGTMNWPEIQASINPPRCRETAKPFDRWRKIAAIIKDALSCG